MLQREGFPPGVPAWIDTDQPDGDAATRFYARLFAWDFEPAADLGGAAYHVAHLDGRRVAGVGAERSRHGNTPAWHTYIGTDDVEAAAERVRVARGTVVERLELAGLGRAALCVDSLGGEFRLWEPGGLKGAEAVNAPGTWNFSELNTDDVDEATRFYGAVFGWEVDHLDMGGTPATMVRLPGYADFLEQFDPDIRRRHSDFGAPPGFSECVAWILPLREGATPHWSVTFSVTDADAAAAAAREMGGTVLVEPYDIAPVRSTVIRDPAGAQFTANSFNAG
jgi:uncharacterized protein